MSLHPWAVMGPVTVQWELSGSRKVQEPHILVGLELVALPLLGWSPSSNLVSAVSYGVGTPHTAVSELPFGVLRLSDHCF